MYVFRTVFRPQASAREGCSAVSVKTDFLVNVPVEVLVRDLRS